jgi:hypothetical protein
MKEKQVLSGHQNCKTDELFYYIEIERFIKYEKQKNPPK